MTGRVDRVPVTAAPNVIATVQEAMAQAPSAVRRRGHGGSTLPIGLQRLSWLFAIYLCYVSLRIQELVTVLAVPKLPMLLSIGIAALLVVLTPSDIWRQVWQRSNVIKWQLVLFTLALGTIPIGIWMGRSFERFWPGYVISMMVFLASLILLRDRLTLFRVLGILTVALAGITVLVLVGFNVQLVEASGRVMFGATLDPNDLAWVLATFVPIAILLGVRHRPLLPVWWGSAGLFAAGIVATESRGGLVALASSAAVMLLFGTSGWRRILLLGALGIGGAAMLAFIESSGASRLTDLSGYAGGTGRTELWIQGVRWMFSRPWGLGMGNYDTYNYWVTGGSHSGHSAFINVGTELGLLGLIAYVAIWVSGINGLRRARRIAVSTPERPESRHEATVLGLLLATAAANIVGSAFINVQYTAMTLFIQAVLTAATLNGAAPQAFSVPAAPPELQGKPRLRRRPGEWGRN